MTYPVQWPRGEDGVTAVQEGGAIVAVEPVGEYVEFAIAAPGVARGFRPGQFVAVGVGGPRTSMLLRRSFALYDAADGVIRFVVAEQGPGTQWLMRCRVGDVLDLVGPLGTPFPSPPPGTPAVLAGGGYGTAPLLPLGRELAACDAAIEFVVGAASGSRLFGAVRAAIIGPVTVTTDDGSTGTPGRVTDVLPAAIKRIDAQIVYACGPMAMLRAVGDIAREHGLPAYVAVEEAMACGIGVCMTCVLPVRGNDGISRFIRSCVDGPVFAADRVRFADVGRLPDDLFGADAMRGH
jgi:dihydroorotate dehydrogenase electron transfer subunit